MAKAEDNSFAKHIEQFIDKPLDFVLFVFDWGVGELEGETGPDKWQTELLTLIGTKTLTITEAIQIAVRSGHGIGKSALIAWIILWFISTRPHPQIVVTANTSSQLDTKTWRELAKWHKLAINREWFTWTATKFHLNAHPETWFAAAIPWSKQRAQAFAGTHEKHILMLFDEASEIEDIIWETAEGAMTTEGAMWIAFGNPTQNTGRFSECFKKYRHRWITREIDSRTAKKANITQIQKWIDDYGEDSDFVRVRVTGQEPRSGSLQFIPNDIVEAAMGRSIAKHEVIHQAKVISVDIARFGDDQSVICKRQGLMVWPLLKFRKIDSMTLASRIHQEAELWGADGILLDMGNIGAAVYDYLTVKLGRKDVIGVWFGSTATNDKKYFNKRAEMWGDVLEALNAGLCLPEDKELRDDLISPQYGFDNKERIQLEKKEDMKSRGIASPDSGDAVAISYAQVILPKSKKPKTSKDIAFEQTEDWSPFDKEYA